MQNFLLICLGLGGILNGVASFTAGDVPSLHIEVLWIANDLLLVIGLIGVLLALQHQLNALSQSALVLVIISLAFIAGPSAKLAGVAAYSIGIPFVAFGFLLFSVSCWFSNTVNRGVSLVIAGGVTLSVLASIVNLAYANLIGSLVLSLGIIFLAINVVTLNTRHTSNA